MTGEEKLREIIENESKDGKISCAKCMRIAKDNDISLHEVGKMADELEIKITNCQLGCF